ncbi:MAG TPA: kelch repeat-containing protein [Thermoplasmata archaeon]|nr:kelch repeat-containing protein [Thermoplasmata archaeon]
MRIIPSGLREHSSSIAAPVTGAATVVLVLALLAQSGLGSGTMASATRPASAPLTPLNWTNLHLAGGPGPRAEFGFTWVNASGQSYGLLFGGRPSWNALFNDTWMFVNGTWHLLHLAVHPSARRGLMMTYDPIDGYVVLFGGSNSTSYLNDTWAFSRGAWVQLHPSVSPPARRVGGFTYDASDGYVLLFSGHNGSSLSSNHGFTVIDDTWAFVQGSWTKLHPKAQPPGRDESSMAYDPIVGQVVLFGGYYSAPHYHSFKDTWVFHAGVWKRLLLAVSPSQRDGAATVYDPALQGVLIEGGQNESGNVSTLDLNDTWVLVGNSVANLSWVHISTPHALAPNDGATAVFDTATGKVVLFGGRTAVPKPTWYGKTWELS